MSDRLIIVHVGDAAYGQICNRDTGEVANFVEEEMWSYALVTGSPELQQVGLQFESIGGRRFWLQVPDWLPAGSYVLVPFDLADDLVMTNADQPISPEKEFQWDGSSIVIPGVVTVGSGEGANEVTITVVDEDDEPLENVRVRARAGASSFLSTTDADGETDPTFGLDDADWTLTVTLAGYEFDSVTPGTGRVITVDAAHTEFTVTMNAVVAIAPDAPNLAVGAMTILDTEGGPEPDVEVTFRLVKGPGTSGYGYDSMPVTVTSNGSGVITRNFVRGARYGRRRGHARNSVEDFFTVPDADNFDIDELVGSDA